ncbi:LOW QUALITY PROTEIN: uncharacterized protein V5649_009918 [Rhynchonycteris naso]
MPFTFERATRGLVKEIGHKELRPVKSLLSATKLHRFTLIRRKKALSQFWKLRDIPLDVSLMHILEPDTSVPDVAVKAPVLFSDTVVKKQQAVGSVDAGAQVSFSGEATQCQGSSFECQIVTTPHETWTELRKRKLMDPEPSFLGQCRKAATNLYVVTETVELLKDTELKNLSSQNILGKFSIPLNIFVKGKGQGGGHKVSEKKLTVPQGSVVAYKRKQLVFKEEGWGPTTVSSSPGTARDTPLDILHIAEDDEEETFPQAPEGRDHQEGSGRRREGPDGAEEVKQEGEHSERAEFKHLREEVSQTIREAQLSKEARDTVFSNIRAMLGDREALQDLMDMLEQEPLGYLSGSGGTILNELQKNSCSNSDDFVLYLLESIMVLSDIQHDLLAYSMEKEILSQQRDLVQSILEPNFLCSGTVPFTLNPELLAPLQGECLSITYGLLAECGLKMELNSPMSAWEPEAKEPLCALYAALCILQQLAECGRGLDGSPVSEPCAPLGSHVSPQEGLTALANGKPEQGGAVFMCSGYKPWPASAFASHPQVGLCSFAGPQALASQVGLCPCTQPRVSAGCPAFPLPMRVGLQTICCHSTLGVGKPFLHLCASYESQDAAVKASILFSDTVVNKQQVGGSVDAGTQGEGQGSGRKVREKKLTVPQGSVVAYRRKRLVFKGNGWRNSLHVVIINHTRDHALLGAPPPGHCGTLMDGIFELGLVCMTEDTSEGAQEVFCVPKEFKDLQKDILMRIREAQLSKNTWNTVFSNIRAMLGDCEALQDLMDMLEEKSLGDLSGPGGTILNELQNDSRCHYIFSEDLILYLLEAIMVLSDIQHDLLVSMEKEILSQQRDLVQSILEPNFLCSGTIPFTLNPELLAPLQGECLSITYGLLAECGLKMELNSPMSAWEPEAKEPLCALYGTLCILQQLAES